MKKLLSVIMVFTMLFTCLTFTGCKEYDGTYRSYEQTIMGQTMEVSDNLLMIELLSNGDFIMYSNGVLTAKGSWKKKMGKVIISYGDSETTCNVDGDVIVFGLGQATIKLKKVQIDKRSIINYNEIKEKRKEKDYEKNFRYHFSNLYACMLL